MVICPTVTAFSAKEFNNQMERIEEFVERVHLDFMDGEFAPTKSPPIEQAWWPIGIVADLHVMFKRPLEYLETIISLNPSLVVIHAEADDAQTFMLELDGLGIRRGTALLKQSQPKDYAELITLSDHVLIFSGDLGHFGGIADVELLQKINEIHAVNPDIEIGWDGGINEKNIKLLVDGGVDVLNVGGYIQQSPEPKKAYDTLLAALAG